MCGIVGAVGHKQCSNVLLDALKRLEYRGYDSSGIVTIHDSAIALQRATGKLVNLDLALKETPLLGDVGIGHTRWATHGGVSTENAHPHVASGRVAIVHNGIIENHRTIRARLEAADYHFSSDTDSEVLAHLFVEAFDAGLDPAMATRQVLDEIDGAYAFAVMTIDHPDLLIVARNASPLALGLGDDACYI
ncbi:MAG: glutamine--fructose-6-phosphate aminotransferase, partial [Candidatus Puniceispirillaceae bacterium]